LAKESEPSSDPDDEAATDRQSVPPVDTRGTARDQAFEQVLRQLAGADLDAPLSQGAKIGQYEVERELGSGGFGTVYRCRDPVIGKVVAIKVLERQFSMDPVYAERFLEEARAAARIGHEGIVDVLGFGALPDGRRYLVMEYLRGNTLSELLMAPGGSTLALDDKLVILEQVAHALDAAHAAGIVHRDIKPANVFVTRTSHNALRAKLLDFGIAKRVDDEAPLHTGAGMILGTPAYMSPEQCEGHKVTPSADIYSLGVMAFELLSGERPWNVRGATALRAAHVRSEPPRASEVQRALPGAVDAPLLSMLAKNPAARPPSASEPILALRAALATPTSDPRRRRTVMALAVAGLAAVAAGVLAATCLPKSPARSTPPAQTTGSASHPEVTPPSAPAVPAPASVTLRVNDAPPGAALQDEQGNQHDVRDPLRLDRGTVARRFTLSAPLHRPREIEIVPDRDQEVDGRLSALPGHAPAGAAHKKRSQELEY